MKKYVWHHLKNIPAKTKCELTNVSFTNQPCFNFFAFENYHVFRIALQEAQEYTKLGSTEFLISGIYSGIAVYFRKTKKDLNVFGF